MRALALVLGVSVVSASAGCEFAVKHPAVTAAIVGGSVGLATCEIGTDFEASATCPIIGGGAAAVLGGVVGLAILLGGEGHTVLQEPMTEDPPPLIRDKKKPEPAPAPAPAPTPTPAPAPAPTPPP